MDIGKLGWRFRSYGFEPLDRRLKELMQTYPMPEDFDSGCSEICLEKILQLMEVYFHHLRIMEVFVSELAVEFEDSEAVHVEREILLGASDI